jgi:hypothetical protein
MVWLWLSKQRAAVLREWRENKIGYGEAVRRLVELGINLESAHQIIAAE